MKVNELFTMILSDLINYRIVTDAASRCGLSSTLSNHDQHTRLSFYISDRDLYALAILKHGDFSPGANTYERDSIDKLRDVIRELIITGEYPESTIRFR